MDFMIEILEELKVEIIVMFFSMLPLIELRGAIPLGISLGLNPWQSAIISILGNILVVFILLNILNPVMIHFERTKFFSATLGKIKERSMKKSSVIKKYSLLGLFIFVSLPIPTTGAWTGALISSILKLDVKKAFVSMSLGIVVAGIITLTISHSIFTIL
ncbi:putative small multi-drug export protein [Tissierella creatinophila DSM 6911]|uniref:Putative small multi-drug export protein n=2 Tax=Tissierella creatinophila TaxID=79681 RepID=A0A1U7M3H4_TISCR|nr:putative small multi-drug export protein [Tissierella creatinophila DSM 6911]